MDACLDGNCESGDCKNSVSRCDGSSGSSGDGGSSSDGPTTPRPTPLPPSPSSNLYVQPNLAAPALPLTVQRTDGLSPQPAASDPFGTPFAAMTVDGNTMINFPANLLPDVLRVFTLSVWLFFPNINGGGSTTAIAAGMPIEIDAEGDLQYRCGSTTLPFGSTTALCIGQWCHVGVSISAAGGATLVVNGNVRVNSDGGSGCPPASAWGPANGGVSFGIWGLVIYQNHAASVDELVNFFETPPPPPPPPPPPSHTTATIVGVCVGVAVFALIVFCLFRELRRYLHVKAASEVALQPLILNNSQPDHWSEAGSPAEGGDGKSPRGSPKMSPGKGIASGFEKIALASDVWVPRMQALVDGTCRRGTLGIGRDQAFNEVKYNKMVVQRVSLIKNGQLWSQYCTERELHAGDDVGEKLKPVTFDYGMHPWMKGMGLRPELNEFYLWHGTKPDIVDKIAGGGFDERVSYFDADRKQIGGLFGAGVYFAEHCSKSDQYCTPEPFAPDGTFYLILARVTMLKFFWTEKGLKNQRRAPDGFDSVVGQLSAKQYREFIVYDRRQTYPEYIVEYKRGYDPSLAPS